MANAHEVSVHLRSTADTQAVDQFQGALRGLLNQLDQAKASMATATPESAAYQATATSVGELAGQVSQLLGEVGKLVTAEEASAKAAATTATARRDEAQATVEAAKAQEALNRSKQADMRNQAVADARRQMAEDLRKAEADTARLAVAAKKVNEEHKKTPAVAGAAAESTRNAGLAALMFSQALEDAQYGISGVINNIPGLVLAMGGSMGLAGVVSVAAVAVSQLVQWLGKSREEAGKINWAQMTPEDAQVERLKKLNEQLEKQAESIAKLAEAWAKKAESQSKALDAEKQYAEYQDKLRKMATGEGDPQNTLKAYDDRSAARQQEVSNADFQATGAKVNAERMAEMAAQTEVQARMEERRVAELKRRAELEIEEKKEIDRKAGAEKALARSHMGEGLPDLNEMARLRKIISEAEVNLGKIRPEMEGLAKPDIRGTGSEKTMETAKRVYFEQAQEGAAQLRRQANEQRAAAESAQLEANRSAEDMARLRRKAADEQHLDDQATARKVAEQAGMPEPMLTMPGQQPTILAPGVRGLIRKGTPAPEAAPADAYGDAEQAALRDMQASMTERLKASAAGATGEVKAMLEQAIGIVNDGKGDLRGELEIFQQAYQQAAEDRGQAAEYLKQALDAAGSLGRRVPEVIGGVVSAMQNTLASVETIASRVSNLEAQAQARMS